MTEQTNKPAVLKAFQPSWQSLVLFSAALAYVAYTFSLFGLTSERLIEGFSHGSQFILRLVPPDFSRWQLMLEGILESLQMAIIASFFGIALSLPIGVLAARNIMPLWVTWVTRGFIALCRSFHPVIIAILFVKAVGFGALAGILTLIIFSIGFIAKLFAEAIEEISMKPIEALRATGSDFISILLYAVMPQVFSRFLGFSTYQLDSNVRNSTMVGIVGAGGVGGTLLAAFQRFDYDFVCAILLSIIALILVFEAISHRVRELYQ